MMKDANDKLTEALRLRISKTPIAPSMMTSTINGVRKLWPGLRLYFADSLRTSKAKAPILIIGPEESRNPLR